MMRCFVAVSSMLLVRVTFSFFPLFSFVPAQYTTRGGAFVKQESTTLCPFPFGTHLADGCVSLAIYRCVRRVFPRNHAHLCHYLDLWRAAVKGRLRSEISNIGLIWLCLAPFTPSCGAGIRPGWYRLALGALVRADQRGLVSIVVASLQVARSGKLLILFRFVPFRSIPYRLRGAGMRGSRLRGSDEVFRANDACNQCKGWRHGGAMGICHRTAGWREALHGALHWDGYTGYRRINPTEGLTLEDHQG